MPKLKPQIAACFISLPTDAGGAIQLFPAGRFDAPRGSMLGKGPWHIDANSAQRIIAKFGQRQNDTVIDYDHQSLNAAKNGKPVIAAGWIAPDALEWREGENPGLYARNPKWTAAAAAHIAADELRYISPVFMYDTAGNVLDVINVAVTNTPAIDGMQAIMAAASATYFDPESTNQPDETRMKKQLSALLGLPDTADEAAVLAAVSALKSGTEQVAALSAQIETLKTQAPDPALYMPTSIVTELQTQLAALSAKQESGELDKLIDANINKLPTPGLIAWAKGQSVAALSAFLANAPEIAALSGMQSGGMAPATNEHGLTADELAVCSALNVSVEDFKKTKAA